jgi:transcriptional regulator with XRE-family HTH domain
VARAKLTQAQGVFRDLLRDLRREKNLTQSDLADRLGFPQSYVSKYETGERRLDFIETFFVCEALGITIEEFAKLFSSSRLLKN